MLAQIKLKFTTMVKKKRKSAKMESNFDREIILTKETELIQTELTTIESEINNIIYGLYGLTDDEITIVENSIK